MRTATSRPGGRLSRARVTQQPDRDRPEHLRPAFILRCGHFTDHAQLARDVLEPSLAHEPQDELAAAPTGFPFAGEQVDVGILRLSVRSRPT